MRMNSNNRENVFVTIRQRDCRAARCYIHTCRDDRVDSGLFRARDDRVEIGRERFVVQVTVRIGFPKLSP